MAAAAEEQHREESAGERRQRRQSERKGQGMAAGEPVLWGDLGIPSELAGNHPSCNKRPQRKFSKNFSFDFSTSSDTL